MDLKEREKKMRSKKSKHKEGLTLVSLHDVADYNCDYGILLVDCTDSARVVSEVFKARARAQEADEEWQVSDILDFLPKEWNARVETSIKVGV